MKYLLPIIAIGFCLTSCGNQDQIVTKAAQSATTAILSHIPAGAQTPVANELDVGAVAIRSLKGKLTPSDLTSQITAFFPQSIRDQYPQIVSILVPVVVFAYQTQGETAFASIANGIEAGTAPYITKQ